MLRKGPKTVGQIAKETKIMKKTVRRILEESRILGIATRNEEGVWFWHEHSAKFGSFTEYELTLQHSKKLIKGLDTMLTELLPSPLQENEPRNLMLVECSEQHLKTGYSETYSKIQKYRKLNDETQGVFIKLMQSFGRAKFFTSDKFRMFDWEKVESKSFFKKIFPKYKMKRIDIPYAYMFQSKEQAQQALKEANAVARMTVDPEGKCSVLGPIYFSEPRNKIQKIIEIYGEIGKDIKTLILLIHHGQPLKGKCKLCPQVKISDNSEFRKFPIA